MKYKNVQNALSAPSVKVERLIKSINSTKIHMITIDQIDFSKLKPYDGKVTKCFEQLCYQIAQKEFGHLGKFTPIDGSGGDGGVEFYLELPNGEKWGWQCKFYQGSGRLNESSRADGIKDSLSTACRNHPDLTKWFLCLKTDLTSDSLSLKGKFTKGELNWFNSELPKQLPSGMSVKLQHWGESKLLSYLNSPKHIGIRSFFFGDLEFSKEWFENHFEENFEKVKEKYDSTLHTIDNYTQSIIDCALMDTNYCLQLDKFKEDFLAKWSEIISLIKEIKTRRWLDPSESLKRDEFVSQCENFENHIRNLIAVVELLKGYFFNFSEGLLAEFDKQNLDEEFFEYYKQIDASVFDKHSTLEQEVSTINHAIAEFGDFVHSFFINYFHKTAKYLHFLGDPAKGKTHLSADIAYRFNSREKPVIFLTGDKFNNEKYITEAIQKNLDIPNQYSIDDFIQALDTYGSIIKSKVPLIIDGLNETTFNKSFSPIWQSHLKSFIKKIAKTANVVLITTCRISYKNRVFENIPTTDFRYLRGFRDFEVIEEAVEKYFQKYKIKTDLQFANLERFGEPLFLKIFCESKNPNFESGDEIVVNLDEETTFDIFEEYLNQINRQVTTTKSNLRENDKFIQRSLGKLADYLWVNNLREIEIDRFYDLIDGTKEYDKDTSRADILFNEGLVINRDIRSDEEYVSFTYDLLAGYLIAKNLLDKAPDVKEFISDDFIKRFVKGKDQHPLYEDIMYALCLLLPQRKDICLHDLLERRESPNAEYDEYRTYGFSKSVTSLFKLPAKYIKKSDSDLVLELFKKPENQRIFFEVSLKTLSDVSHPFNGLFISKLLFEMEMNERDVSWTEFIRTKSYDFERLFSDFENQCKFDGEESKILIRRQHVLAQYIKWFLTSTKRRLRDLATRSLYYYGRKFPAEFSKLVYESLKINDPYVWERTLASLYGVCMAEHSSLKTDKFRNEILPEIGKNIHNLMFSKNAPYSTTHILARDYARGVIEICLLHHPKILSAKETARIKPPYKNGGIRKLGEFDYEKQPLGSFDPIQMDFSNYTIGSIVKEGFSYSDPPEKKKVRRQIYWRIFDLGWNEELFSAAEQSINNSNNFYARTDRPETERYGKKYSWIAYFENAGIRKDLGLLEREWEEFRISSADIDPSFPMKIPDEVFITDDLLGDRATELMDWYKDGGFPEIDRYLKVSNLKGNLGEWVCLDGYINQEDVDSARSRFTFIRTLLIKEDDYAEAIKLLKKQSLENRWLPEKLENHYTFAGELYFCPEATHDNFAELEFILGSRTITIKKGDDNYEPIKKFEFVDGGINIITEEPDEIEKTVTDVKTFQIQLPVMEYNWEGYHSELNDSGSATVVSKEIANHLNLVNQPQTFDLFENSGRKASVNLEFQGRENRQHFVYLRGELLDKYLNDNKLKLVHAIWGEREIIFKSRKEQDEFYGKNSAREFKVFQKIIEY